MKLTDYVTSPIKQASRIQCTFSQFNPQTKQWSNQLF